MEKQSLSYDAIGTASAHATLTDDYTDNTFNVPCKYLNNLHLDFIYTPLAGQTDRYVKILIELSNDDGTTYFKRTVQTNTTTLTRVYDNNDGGVHYVFPGDETSTGGVAYDGYLDDNGIVATNVKISVAEDSAGNHGAMYVKATLSN